MPERRQHPLELYIRARGLSLPEAAPYLAMTPRNLTDVIRRWRRPRDAVWLAHQLGFASVDDAFPSNGEGTIDEETTE